MLLFCCSLRKLPCCGGATALLMETTSQEAVFKLVKNQGEKENNHPRERMQCIQLYRLRDMQRLNNINDPTKYEW